MSNLNFTPVSSPTKDGRSDVGNGDARVGDFLDPLLHFRGIGRDYNVKSWVRRRREQGGYQKCEHDGLN